MGSGPAASGPIAVDEGPSTSFPMSGPIGPVVVAGPASADCGATGVIASGMMRGAITGMGATARGAVAGAAARGRAGAGLGVPRAGGGATAGMKGIINLGACTGKGLDAMLVASTAAIAAEWTAKDSESHENRRSTARERTTAVSNMQKPPAGSTRCPKPKNRDVARCNRTMTKLIRDPQLDDLVKELNQSQAEEQPAVPSWPPALIPSGNPIEALL